MAENGAVLYKPLGLLAELTHRCPLGCPYCSNPLALDPRGSELDTQTWARVFAEAAALGVLQVHLSGGTPISSPRQSASPWALSGNSPKPASITCRYRSRTASVRPPTASPVTKAPSPASARSPPKSFISKSRSPSTL